MGKVYSAVVRAYELLASPVIWIVFLLLTVFFARYVLGVGAGTGGARGGLLIQMRLALQKKGWVQKVERLADSTCSIESAIQDRLLFLRRDLAFPVVYVVFLMSCVALATKERDKQPSGWVLVLFLLPVLAGVFDLAENLMRMHLLRGVKAIEDLSNLPEHLLNVAYAFSLLKWLLVIGPPVVAFLVKLNRIF